MYTANHEILLEKVKELHKWRAIDHVCGLEDNIKMSLSPKFMCSDQHNRRVFFFFLEIDKMVLNAYQMERT